MLALPTGHRTPMRPGQRRSACPRVVSVGIRGDDLHPLQGDTDGQPVPVGQVYQVAEDLPRVCELYGALRGARAVRPPRMALWWERGWRPQQVAAPIRVAATEAGGPPALPVRQFTDPEGCTSKKWTAAGTGLRRRSHGSGRRLRSGVGRCHAAPGPGLTPQCPCAAMRLQSQVESHNFKVHPP